VLLDGLTNMPVAALLDGLDIEELLAVPAVPVQNHRGMRYPVQATTSEKGERWYVRSFGTDFALLGRHRGRCYSLGWGLVGAAEDAELLLVHAREANPQAAVTLAGVLQKRLRAAGVAHHVLARDGAEVRVAASLDVTVGEARWWT
jgi:hypothetical protein